ncbi:MAG: GNAT family N-acetyltransferase [Legionellales bacterium]
MIRVDLLKNHSQSIPTLANIWREVLGKIWMPEIGIEEIESLYYEELKHEMPLTYIALDDEAPVGSCTLELNGSIRPDIGPWIGDLVVDSKYQQQGIGKMLVNVIIEKATEFGFKKLYLFAFDPTIVAYYQRLGWKKIGMDEFKSHSVTVMEVVL